MVVSAGDQVPQPPLVAAAVVDVVGGPTRWIVEKYKYFLFLLIILNLYLDFFSNWLFIFFEEL
jgi:hypothetical protein